MTETIETATYIPPTQEEFLAMDKPARRHAIAQDVIAAIHAERIVARSKNGYFNLELPGVTEEDLSGRELQSVLDEMTANKVPCTVCGIGACFVSAVTLGDHLRLGRVTLENSFAEGYAGDEEDDPSVLDFGRGSRKFDSKLREHFTALQLDEIESAFEKQVRNCLSRFNDAARFGKLYLEDGERLIAIMEAILADPRGEFHPARILRERAKADAAK